MTNEYELSPKGGVKINFGAAIAFARKIVVHKKPIRLTSKHKGKRATLDRGWLIIEQEWYPA